MINPPRGAVNGLGSLLVSLHRVHSSIPPGRKACQAAGAGHPRRPSGPPIRRLQQHPRHVADQAVQASQSLLLVVIVNNELFLNFFDGFDTILCTGSVGLLGMQHYFDEVHNPWLHLPKLWIKEVYGPLQTSSDHINVS